MKHFLFIIAAVAAMTFVACEEPNTLPTPPEDDNPQYVPETYPEGTYHFAGELVVNRQVLETNGLRNDYISFYNEDSGNTLYIDFYSVSGGEELASGKYELGNGTSAMTFDQQYTYMTFSGSDDLHRFAEGSVCVAVDIEHESGYPWYHFTAYLVMSNGVSVSLDYEGQMGAMPQVGNL